MIKSYPLESISLEEAMEFQFRFVQAITNNLSGNQVLSMGDLGVTQPENMPCQTALVEKVIAEFFSMPAAILVRGSGTGALRLGLYASIKSNEKLLVHDAPIYPTTKVNVEAMGLNVVKANFNDLDDIKRVVKDNPDIKCSLVQYTRQKINDNYLIAEVIETIKAVNNNIKIITDDNYAAFKVKKIGCELGADISTFSAFKLLGPEGVGVVVGSRKLIEEIRKLNYSGGSQVQGFEAMEVLRGFTYAPVSLAISSMQNELLVKRLNNHEVKGISGALIANAQSKVAIVTLEEPIAKEVIKKAQTYGAAANPVGAESKYELVPMIYRVSSTFRSSIENADDYLIRINPMRSSAQTIINILKKVMED